MKSLKSYLLFLTMVFSKIVIAQSDSLKIPAKDANIIKITDQTKAMVYSLEQLIAGRVAGVQVLRTSALPYAEFSVRVRGFGGLAYSIEPLYIIDGFPINAYNNQYSTDGDGATFVTNALSTINPNDIDSIVVLKEGPALVRYGSQAMHGAIVITTKRGKTNTPKITFETSAGVQMQTRKIQMLTAEQYANLNNQMSLLYNNPVRFPNTSSLGQGTDWMNEIMRTGTLQSHQVGISGTTKAINYLANVSYFNNVGLIKNTGFKRMTARLNLGGHFWKNRISWGSSNLLSNIQNDMPTKRSYYNLALTYNPITPVKNIDGTYARAGISPNPVEQFLVNPVNVANNQYYSNHFI